MKTANPNGPDLPHWPSLQTQPPTVMVLSEHPHTISEPDRTRHVFVDTIRSKE